ncbi:helix-turn-helix domain-containing protein [Halobacillus litoralis]|uniref:helix-turn-helix domain-containing protein n=1 Tax=Halobacillus litoralis TaxID=45668 RepID=UPI001CFCCA93|nr:helix-turn-helix domain-containing protein [Halobacillus litoralis]
MFTCLVLTCVERLKGERTISGIYNLLTGKRSSQTMQDAKGYELDSYFGIFPELKREHLDRWVTFYLQEGLIFLQHQDFPHLSAKGKEQLDAYPVSFLAHFKGMTWHEVIPSFIQRLNLLIQTAANWKVGRTSYVPIVEDTLSQRWVKTVFTKFHSKMEKLSDSLYKEIDSLLSEHIEIEAELFSHRLTGGGVIGMTLDQLKDKYELSQEDVYISLAHTYYFFFQQAKEKPGDFPVLHLCTRGLDPAYLITQSARRTYHYIQQGLSMEEIITIRRLKKSTIQDHIVEAALIVPQFNIDGFLQRSQVEEINQMAQSLDTKRLKQIHQAFEGRYDYFELRLALASGQAQEKERNGSS